MLTISLLTYLPQPERWERTHVNAFWGEVPWRLQQVEHSPQMFIFLAWRKVGMQEKHKLKTVLCSGQSLRWLDLRGPASTRRKHSLCTLARRAPHYTTLPHHGIQCVLNHVTPWYWRDANSLTHFFRSAAGVSTERTVVTRIEQTIRYVHVLCNMTKLHVGGSSFNNIFVHTSQLQP